MHQISKWLKWHWSSPNFLRKEKLILEHKETSIEMLLLMILVSHVTISRDSDRYSIYMYIQNAPVVFVCVRASAGTSGSADLS